jgi:hypothetical protein
MKINTAIDQIGSIFEKYDTSKKGKFYNIFKKIEELLLSKFQKTCDIIRNINNIMKNTGMYKSMKSEINKILNSLSFQNQNTIIVSN